MRFIGALKTWNDERGFGFIEPIGGGQELFVHIRAFPPGTGRPSAGQVLSFEVETGLDGRKKACSVQYPVRVPRATRTRTESPAPWTVPRILAIPVFAGVYALVAWRWGFSPPVLPAYFLMSLIAFLAYAFDKSAAINARRRTSENTLHLIALAGGRPGALVAQQVLRHKTGKRRFIYAFWFTVVLNIVAFVAWHAGILPLSRPPGGGLTRRSCELATTARADGAASVVLLHHVTGADCRLLRLNLNVRLHHTRTLRICRSDSTRYGNVNGYMRGQGRTRMKACGKNGEPAMITSPKDAEGAFGRRLPAWSQSSRITVADRFLSLKRMPP